MHKKFSLRVSNYFSIFLITALLLIFSFLIFTVSIRNSKSELENATWSSFTYANNAVSAMVERMRYTSQTSYHVEQCIRLEDGKAKVVSEKSLCAMLGTIEDTVTPAVNAYFYIRGDKYIYTSQGRYLYSDYERMVSGRFNWSLSSQYSKLQRINSYSIFPILSASGDMYSGLVCAAPFPASAATDAVMFFSISGESINDELSMYLDMEQSNLFIFDSMMNLLYQDQSEERYLSSKLVSRIKGIGVHKMDAPDTFEPLVVLRDALPSMGLHFMLVMPEKSFYASLNSFRRLMLTLLITLLSVITLLVISIISQNLLSIRQLTYGITGRKSIGANENEMTLILDSWKDMKKKTASLSEHIDALSPIVVQQLVNSLIFGRIRNQEDFELRASRSGLDFSHALFCAAYLVLSSEDDEALPMATVIIAHTPLPSAVVATGELSLENAVAVILNFDAEPGHEEETAKQYLTRLCQVLRKNGAEYLSISLGRVYTNPLDIRESFAEACTAHRMAVPSEKGGVKCYSALAGQIVGDETEYHGIAASQTSLLSECIHRGDSRTAVHTLTEIVDGIASSTHSVLMFRFFVSDLLSSLMRQSNSSISVTSARIQHLLTTSTIDEFRQEMTSLVEELCEETRRQLEDEEQQVKQRLMDYILKNYKTQSLSVQAVAEETGLTRAQVSAIVKEETGQNFVQYIAYLRHSEFKKLLLSTDATISELVLQIGYTDIPNFMRKFKYLEGVTPGQYRQQNREAPAQSSTHHS